MTPATPLADFCTPPAQARIPEPREAPRRTGDRYAAAPVPDTPFMISVVDEGDWSGTSASY